LIYQTSSSSKIFFSYSRLDSDFALRLARDLRGEGVDIWMDQLDIHAGDHWDVAVERALAEASCVLVILSLSSTASNNVKDEIALALDSGQRIIPVIIEECQIPFRLRRLKRIDFVKDYQEGFNQLLQTVKVPVLANSSSLHNPDEKDASSHELTADTLPESEIQLWQKAKTFNSIKLFDHYFQKNEKGEFRTLATTAIEDLTRHDRLYDPSVKINAKKSSRPPSSESILFSKSKIILAGGGLILVLLCGFVARIHPSTTKTKEIGGVQDARINRPSTDPQLMPAYVENYSNTSVAPPAHDELPAQPEEDNTIKINPQHNPTDHSYTTIPVNTPKTTHQTKPVILSKAIENEIPVAEFKPGQHDQGGTIVYINASGMHGLILADKEFGLLNFETATKRTLAYKYEGFGDWRLPSKEELNLIYTSRQSLSPMSPGMMWSSTNVNQVSAWTQDMDNGNIGYLDKGMSCITRAVRTF